MMIDLHCHILPKVDDGASSLEEAVEMARIARDSGIKTIVATPHYIEDVGCKNYRHNSEVMSILKKELLIEGIDIKILLGNEVFITPDMLTLLDRGEIGTINDTRYILMELPMLDIPMYVESLIYELRLNGLIPIIAHPERNLKIIDDPNILHNFISKGALTQINIPSILGKYGEVVQRTVKVLLKYDMVHFAGTDSHTSNARSLKPQRAIKMITDIIGKRKINKLLYINPHAVVNNQEIFVDDAERYVDKKGVKQLFKRVVSRSF